MDNLEHVFKTYWKAVEEEVVFDFDESLYVGTRAGYFLVTDQGIYVNGIDDDLNYKMLGWNEYSKGV